MLQKQKWNSALTVIRYLLIFILIINYIDYNETESVRYLVILLVFIINNQLRFFCFESRSLRLISLLMDFIILALIHPLAQFIFSIYFLLTAIDAVLLLCFRDMCILNTLLFLEMLILYRRENWICLLINSILYIVFILMTRQLEIEHNRAREAHSLYDRLRIKEEQLLELNKELEGYASTVETLTLLRERNRITREIHDHLGHRLSTSIIQLGAVEKMIDIDSNKASDMVKYLREYNQESLRNVREVINELKPAQLEMYEGLLTIEQLISGYEKLTGIRVKLNINHSDMWKLSEKQNFAVYRIIQELLSNSLRHGNAKNIDIFFNFKKDQLLISFRDNGIGNDRVEEGNGIRNMRQRSRELGGDFRYETGENQGFLAIMHLPLIKEGESAKNSV